MSGLPRRSSYLEYLPPVLWDGEEDPFLGRLLLAFEKILTGVDDVLEVRVDRPIQGGRRARIADPGGPSPTGLASSVRYEPIEAVIDGIHNLFNPRRTPADFLPYLASWVAFDPGSPPRGGADVVSDRIDWEARTRARIAQIARIYQTGGTKRGLLLSIDVFTANRFRPRVAVDDGESVFRLRPTVEPAEPSPPTAVAFAGTRPFVDSKGTSLARKWLLAPQAVAIGTDGPDGPYLVIADGGPSIDPALIPPPDPTVAGAAVPPIGPIDRVRPGLWRVSPSGEPLDWAATPPGTPSFPVAMNEADFASRFTLKANGFPDPAARILQPRGLAVDPDGRVFVLDQGFRDLARPAVFVGRPQAGPQGRPRGYDFATLIPRASFPAGVTPLDMAADRAGKTLFVVGIDVTAGSHLIVIRVGDPDAPSPTATTIDCTLPDVSRPGAVAVQAEDDDGSFTLLIADPRAQILDDDGLVVPPDPYPEALRARLAVDLVRVKVAANQAAAALGSESLLVAPAAPRKAVPPGLNPLIGPTGLAIDPRRPTRCLICDTGTKDRANAQLSPREGDSIRADLLVRAEPARVFEVELGPEDGQAVIRPLTPDPHLVTPTRLAIEPASGTVFVADEGIRPDPAQLEQPTTTVAARDRPHRIRLSLIFSGERPPKDPDVMLQTLVDLERVVRSELPAQVGWNWEFFDSPTPIRPPSTPFR